MGYDKGKIAREQILEAASAVVFERGFAATSIMDLTNAAGTTAGKLTHHFPTKVGLFEAILGEMVFRYRSVPLRLLGDVSRPPQRRIEDYLDEVYRFYAGQSHPLGCPFGHAAGDAEGVSPAMRAEVFALLQDTEAAFERAFRDLGCPPSLARTRATLFVSSWQGAVVMARAGGGLDHIQKVFHCLRSTAA